MKLQLNYKLNQWKSQAIQEWSTRHWWQSCWYSNSNLKAIEPIKIILSQQSGTYMRIIQSLDGVLLDLLECSTTNEEKNLMQNCFELSTKAKEWSNGQMYKVMYNNHFVGNKKQQERPLTILRCMLTKRNLWRFYIKTKCSK